MAVITAVELEDAAPPIAATRDTHRGGHGFGAADHEAHQLCVRIRREHALRELTFEPVRGAESEALARRALHGLDHPRMGVTEDQRAPGHAQVEVTIAVFVDGMGAAGFLEEHRRAAHLAEGAHRARDTGRDQRLSARVECGRARERRLL